VTTEARSSRREFFARTGRGAVRLAVAGTVLGAVVGLRRNPVAPRSIEVRDKGILRPPGALDEAAFLSACSRCNLCAQVCDTNCLLFFAPTQGELAGTPHIVAEDRACNLCLQCTQVCPTGALTPLEDKARVDMGEALVDERLCVSHAGTGICGACHAVCPMRNKAITQGIRNAPTVHDDHCVGCGMCEEACIVDDRKAIRVISPRRFA